LLLKQTLEETYDPGALLLHGPNVKFTFVDQLLSRMGRGKTSDTLVLGITVGSNLRSEEHTSELQSRFDLVCRLLLEKKKWPVAGRTSNLVSPGKGGGAFNFFFM